jgi:hypothetical protein
MDGVLQDGFIYSVFTEPFVVLLAQSAVSLVLTSRSWTLKIHYLMMDKKYHRRRQRHLGWKHKTPMLFFFRSKKIVDSLVDGLSLMKRPRRLNSFFVGSKM